MMVEWIMESVSDPQFSTLNNGNFCGYFNGTRSLRQGCPLSPDLLCMVMEFYLTTLRESTTRGKRPIDYPFSKGNISISHLFFADDVMIFAAIPQVATNIKCILQSLSTSASLTANCTKSSILFSNYEDDLKKDLISNLSFKEANLPVRYLGLPLFSSRLRLNDCLLLIEKHNSKLARWKGKLLSYAGKIELINSTFTSFHLY